VLKAAESGAGVFAARQAVLVEQFECALQRAPKRGRPPAKGVAVAVKFGRALAAPTPSVQSDDALKCCCGVAFKTIASLKRHHNGIGGKLPRERAHACTAGCNY